MLLLPFTWDNRKRFTGIPTQVTVGLIEDYNFRTERSTGFVAEYLLMLHVRRKVKITRKNLSENRLRAPPILSLR